MAKKKRTLPYLKLVSTALIEHKAEYSIDA